MTTKILTAIAMLLIIVSVAGCASSKPMPDAAQLQTPASTAEQPLLQELRESVDESKATDSHTEAKPEGTAEKEMITSTLPTESVQTEPAPESAPTAIPETPVESVPTQPTEVSSQPTEPAKPTVPEPEPTAPPQPTESPKPTEPSPTEPAPTVPVPTEPQPTEPEGCTHDWQCIHHDEEGHWLAGIICDCGWTVYGSPDEVSAAWNAHSASFPPEESLFDHGGFGCVDEWVVDTPAYEEWYCSLCGEAKP